MGHVFFLTKTVVLVHKQQVSQHFEDVSVGTRCFRESLTCGNHLFGTYTWRALAMDVQTPERLHLPQLGFPLRRDERENSSGVKNDARSAWCLPVVPSRVRTPICPPRWGAVPAPQATWQVYATPSNPIQELPGAACHSSRREQDRRSKLISHHNLHYSTRKKSLKSP